MENSDYLLRRNTIHSSWLIALSSICLLIGVYLGQFTSIFSSATWLIISIILLIAGLNLRSRTLGMYILVLGGLLLGMQQGSSELRAQSALQGFIGSSVELQARVAEDPTITPEGDTRLRLRDVTIDGQSYGGEVWTATRGSETRVRRSDIVRVRGLVSHGFGTIPAAMYRAQIIGVQSPENADVARDARDWFSDNIRESVSDPQASLGAGFLLGQKTALPEKLDIELRLLGLTHIVVASGYNLSILVRYGRRMFERISRFSALALGGGLVFFFANITGFSPSMTRASIITGLSLLAWYYGRKFHPLVLLSISAAITVMINPTYAWGDLGWLLSFTSFIGVIVLSPLIHSYFWGDKKANAVRQVTVETFSAQLLTLPLIMLVFGAYSPLSLIANALILPLIPLAMLLTCIAGMAGVLLPSAVSQIIGWPAEFVMGYMTKIVDFLAQQPLASREVQISTSVAICMYVLLSSFIIFLWRRTGYRFREYNIVE